MRKVSNHSYKYTDQSGSIGEMIMSVPFFGFQYERFSIRELIISEMNIIASNNLNVGKQLH